MTTRTSLAAAIGLGFLALTFSSPARAQAPTSTALSQQSLSYSRIADDIQAHVGERSFWDQIPLPALEVRLVVFAADNTQTATARADYDALAIIPELNATYEYRFCGERVLRVWQEDLWITWTPWTWSPGGKRLNADDYLAQTVSRFADFVSRAIRMDQTLALSSDPARLFRVSPEFKAQRIAQIQEAATQLFHQRLQMQVANFSEYSDKIDALIPLIDQMVTFNVVRACSEPDEVVVGRDYSLRTIRPDLRTKIEANYTIIMAIH